MQYVCDTIFQLADEDFLEAAELSSDKIEEMVLRIADVLGYSTCTSFDNSSYTKLDALYDENKSVVIPYFVEDFSDGETHTSLTAANVSFMVLTSKSGVIAKPDGQTNYCNPSEDSDPAKERVVNVKYYRYARENKFDCYPVTSDFIAKLFYEYDDTAEACKVTFGEMYFYMLEKVIGVSSNPNNKPLLPTLNQYNYRTLLTDLGVTISYNDDNNVSTTPLRWLRMAENLYVLSN